VWARGKDDLGAAEQEDQRGTLPLARTVSRCRRRGGGCGERAVVVELDEAAPALALHRLRQEAAQRGAALRSMRVMHVEAPLPALRCTRPAAPPTSRRALPLLLRALSSASGTADAAMLLSCCGLFGCLLHPTGSRLPRLAARRADPSSARATAAKRCRSRVPRRERRCPLCARAPVKSHPSAAKRHRHGRRAVWRSRVHRHGRSWDARACAALCGSERLQRPTDGQGCSA